MLDLLRSKTGALIIAFATAAFGSAPLSAQTTYTWNLPSGGDWGTAADWSPGTGFPGSNSTVFDTANFSSNPTGNYAITISAATATVAVNALNFSQTDPTAGNGYTVSGGTINLGGTATPTINVVTAGVVATIGSTLSGTALNVNTAGAGTLVLTGSSTYTGQTTVSGGVLTYSGAAAKSGTGALVVGGAAGNQAVVNFSGSGTLTFNGTFNIGGGTTGSGAVYQSSGTVNALGNTGYLTVGNGGYGSYVLSGGTLTSTSAAGFRIGAGGSAGIFTQTGGTLVANRYFAIGSVTAGATGVATFTGGTASVASGYRWLVGDTVGITAVLNLGTLAGGSAALTNANTSGIQVTDGNTTTGSGTINLDSGVFNQTAGNINKGGAAAAVATVNFNGGTLKAGATGLTLINNTLNGVNVFNGGAIFDSNAFTTTVSANLLGTAGNGVYAGSGGGTIPVASGSGGSGYIGAPAVAVTGGTGSGAMAIANVSGGAITGVTLTNPGQNYSVGDVLSFAFAGGGATTSAATYLYTLTAANVAANGIGGITKINTGTLVLSGTNSYTGFTNVQGGTLQLGSAGALPATTSVVLGTGSQGSGTLDLNGQSPTVFGLSTGSSIAGLNIIGNSSTAAASILTFAGGSSSFGGTIQNVLGSGTQTVGLAISSGTLTLVGTNTYSGGTTLSGGQLNINSASAIGTGPLTLAGGNFNNSGTAAVTLGGNNPQNWNANFTFVGSQSLNLGTGAVTLGASPVVTVTANTLTVGGIVSGSGFGITKAGAGTLALTNAANAYNGATAISAGTLQIVGGSSYAGAFTVGNGAALNVANPTATATAVLGSTLTFGSVSTDATTLNLNAASNWTANSSALLSVAGSLTLNGGAATTTINISSTANLGIGVYNLIGFTGSLGGTGLSAFREGSLPSPRLIGGLQVANSTVQLNVTSIDSPKWTGAINGTWDINTTANWKLITGGTASTYLQGDTVLFDDSATGTTAITLGAAVTPSNITFNNSSLSYSITGSGSIGGAGLLTKNGTGTTVLGTANSYSGGTTLNAGVLSVAADNNLGTGNITIGGGTLRITGSAAFASAKAIALNYAGSFDIENTVGALFSGAITGNYGLTKSGPGTLILSGINAYTGLTTVSGGTLQIGDGTNTGALPGNVTNSGILALNPGVAPLTVAGAIGGTGTVQLLGNTAILTGANTFTTATTVAAGNLQIGDGMTTGTTFPSASVAVASGTITFNPAPDVTLYSGTISGSGGVVKAGANPFALTGANTYAGTTSITGGTLTVTTIGSAATPGNLGTGGGLAIGGGGTLVYNGIGETVAGPITAGTGNGTINITSATASVIFNGAVGGNNQLTVFGPGGATLNGVISGTGTGLLVDGGATVTLTGANSNGGATTVNTGTLNFTGGAASSGGGTLQVAGVDGSIAVVNFNSTGTLTFSNSFNIGIGTVGAGAVNQTAGTVNAINSSNGGYLTVGNGGYGSYVLSGGTLDSSNTSGFRIGAGGIAGIFTQTGGTLISNRYFAIGSVTTGAVGIATFTGGTASVVSGYRWLVGDTVGITAVLNLGTQAGGNATLVSANGSGFQITDGNATSGSGTLNLNSGILNQSAGNVNKGGTAGAVATVNFNGGTLQAGAAGLTLINNTLNGVNVFNGGAVFDTNSYTATVSANLLGTTGNGIYAGGGAGTIPIAAGNGGSGYIGAPAVAIGGGSGSGAMAIANVAGGVITGITLTNPGQGYIAGDALNFTFSGGGTNSAAGTYPYTLTAADLAANAIGGLTKIGVGTLILSGTNSYTGPTAVQSGTLQLAAAGALPSATTVILGSGASTAGILDLNGQSPTVFGLATATTGGAGVNLIGNSSTTSPAVLNFSGGTSSFGGTIQDVLGSGTQTVGLTVAGGTLNLNGTNTYTGPTAVNAGTLGGTGSLVSAVTVASGARIRGDSGAGTGTLTVGSTTVQAGGTIFANIGASGTSSQLAVGANTLNLATGSTLQLTALPGFAGASGTYTIAGLTSAGVLQLDGAPVSNGFVYGSYVQGTGASGPVAIDTSAFGYALNAGNTFQLESSGNNLVLAFSTTPVPEPTWLLALASGILAVGRRRKLRLVGM